jgi:serine phosphatase RsbU (regulator of sigma subunit)
MIQNQASKSMVKVITLTIALSFSLNIVQAQNKQITQETIAGVYYGQLRKGQSRLTEKVVIRLYENGHILAYIVKNKPIELDRLAKAFTWENRSQFGNGTYQLAQKHLQFKVKLGVRSLFFDGSIDAGEGKSMYLAFEVTNVLNQRKLNFNGSRVWTKKIEFPKSNDPDPVIEDEVVKIEDDMLPTVEPLISEGELISGLERSLAENKLDEAASNLNQLGAIDYENGDYEQAKSKFQEAFNYKQIQGDTSGMGLLLNNIGTTNEMLGQFGMAIKNYNQAKSLFQSSGDKAAEAETINNIANAEKSRLNVTAERSALNELIEVEKELKNNPELSASYNNLAINYISSNELDKAMETITFGIELDELIDNKKGLAIAYNNKGNIEFAQEDYTSSRTSYDKALNYKTELKDFKSASLTLHNIGNVFRNQGELDSALAYYESSLSHSEPAQYNHVTHANYRAIADLISKKDGCSESLEYYKLYTAMRFAFNENLELKQLSEEREKYFTQRVFESDTLSDTIVQLEQKQQYQLTSINKLQTNIRKQKHMNLLESNAKQSQIDSISIAQELLTANHEVVTKKHENASILLYWIGTGALLSLILLFLAIKSRNKNVKSKKEIALQKDEIELQKDIVEEKNQEITDSITYAKRIQDAILPPLAMVNKALPNSFVLYKPKDIVAGDFYWLNTANGSTIFAAADCTGHGVPGAMVSVVCNNALNRAVREFGLSSPGKILDKTRELVVETFEASYEEVKDGMDIALCSLKKGIGEKYILEYAGANNPLWLIRNGEIIETKADKQAIGKVDQPKPFTTHEIVLLPTDTFYIFSDGFVDQFGGERGKKYKAKAFRKLLLSVQNQPMEKQRQLINKDFETWKGDLEQLDDVCILGVRL